MLINVISPERVSNAQENYTVDLVVTFMYQSIIERLHNALLLLRPARLTVINCIQIKSPGTSGKLYK